MLWLVIFGETFNRLHAIPTGDVPYLDFLAPGVIAQSGMFVAIFYGIQIIWERDAGVLDEAARDADAALGAGHRQGVRGRHPGDASRSSSCWSLVGVLGVALTYNPLDILGAFAIVMRARRSSRACR